MGLNTPVEFSIDVKGEVTGERYVGVFKAHPHLSRRAILSRDQMRRDLLGGQAPQDAGEEASNLAHGLAHIYAHLDAAPNWWKDAQNGLGLLDETPINSVYIEVIRIETEALKALQKSGEESGKVLAQKEG